MRVATIYYNENTDITQIKWTEGFIHSDWVTKMDIIKDLRGIVGTANDHVYYNHRDGAEKNDSIPRTIYED
jgi:hypothetical protein